MNTSESAPAKASSNSHLAYRADVDGLRAIAVMMVVLYHAGFGFPGGFIGVDVFFVISGYLITGLIRKQQEAGTFSLAQFWHRRICRIVPAATLVVMATMIAGWFLFLPSDYVVLGKSAIAQQLMLSNVYFWRNTGYFDGASELMPLLHTWSLAVEEQFYLFYPILMVMFAKASRVRLAIALVIAFVISLVTSEALCWVNLRSAFFLLPSRSWEMILGGLIAIIPATKFGSRTFNQTTAMLGFAGILIASFTYQATMRFPGVWALIPCVSTALMIAGNSRQETWVSKLFSLKPIVLTGQMSYSIYLWHWPILAFGRYWLEGEQFQWFAAASVVVTLLVSYASWRWVEQPIRKWGSPLHLSNSLWRFAFSVTFLGACAFGVVALKGVPERIPVLARDYAAAAQSQSHIFEHTLDDVKQGRLPRVGYPSSTLKLMVWGDSHAMAMMPAFDKLAQELPIEVVQLTRSATPPLLNCEGNKPGSYTDDNRQLSRAIIDFIESDNVQVVVMIAFWSRYANRSPSFGKCFKETIRSLLEMGVEVWVVQDIPTYSVNVPRYLAKQAFWGSTRVYSPNYAGHKDHTRRVEGVLSEYLPPGCLVIDPSDVYRGPPGDFVVIKDGKVLYRDSHHLSVEGAALLVPFLSEIIVQKVNEKAKEEGEFESQLQHSSEALNNSLGVQ